MANRAYKTLPTAFKRDQDRKSSRRSTSDNNRPNSRSRGNAASPLNSEGLFSGLELKLGIANFISNGMNLFGQLRRKTPTTSTSSGELKSASSPTTSSSENSMSSGAYWECQQSQALNSTATTANVSELIEMTSFKTVPLAEGDLKHQSGKGHDFVGVASFNPTWCDLCRDLIWGLYDTGAMKCANCQLTCHEKCRDKVQLNCTAFERPEDQQHSSTSGSGNNSSSNSNSSSEKDLSTLANISTIVDEEIISEGGGIGDFDDDQGTLKNVDLSAFNCDETTDEVTSLVTDPSGDESTNTLVQSCAIDVSNILEYSQIAKDDLQSAIMLYNDGFPTGQETILHNGHCKGFIRVVMNLSRPINVLPGTRPPSVLNLTQDASLYSEHQLTSFYLPPDTEKALCITSTTTTHDVIRSLLAKFRIVDNPHKYILYEKKPQFQRRRSSENSNTVTISGSTRSRATLGRVNLRKLAKSDRPLMIALNNSLRDDHKSVFVLQENDPGEIDWESFTMPELKNFLLILDREEAWYKLKIHEKYEMIHEHMKALADQKKAEENIKDG